MKLPYPPEAIKQIEELQEENRLMRLLRTKDGFFQYYFTQLKIYRTNIECFNAVNDKYFDLFGEYRYSTYNSFQNQQRKYQNQK